LKTDLFRWNCQRGWTHVQGTNSDVAQLVIYFGSSDLIRTDPPFEALRLIHDKAMIVGCSAGTQIIADEVEDDGLAAVAISFESIKIRSVCHTLKSTEFSFDAGVEIASLLVDDDLGGLLIFSDGLDVNGTQLIDGVTSVVGPEVSIAGGLAGDGARFKTTAVGLNSKPTKGNVVGIGLYGEGLRMSQSAIGGWNSFGPTREISRAIGNVLFELDSEHALDLYERYLGDEAKDLPSSALLYPLNIWDPKFPDHRLVRTVLGVDKEARTMTFAGDIPQGWCAQLMRGTHSNLVQGAANAGIQAQDLMRLTNGSDQLALLVSCVGRRLLMANRTADETEAVREALLPNTTQIGFYSYGELGVVDQLGQCSLHNQTMTVTLIAEEVV
jgi:hypothetical protein